MRAPATLGAAVSFKRHVSSMNPQGYIWLAVGAAIFAILVLAGLLKYGLA